MRILRRTYPLAHMITFDLHTRCRDEQATFVIVIQQEGTWQESRHVPLIFASNVLMAAVAVLVVPPKATSNSGPVGQSNCAVGT